MTLHGYARERERRVRAGEPPPDPWVPDPYEAQAMAKWMSEQADRGKTRNVVIERLSANMERALSSGRALAAVLEDDTKEER